MRNTSILIGVATVLLLSGGVRGADAINLRRTVTVEVVEKTKGAVVNISATKIITERTAVFGNPFFDQFGQGDLVQREAGSLGSGFIIHRDGYVVTNNHVIDRARKITVELDDGRKLPAEIVSAESDADIAILKISSDKPLPTLELGDSSDLMIGEPVIAVGNPFGFSHSVSTGIVSAIHRELKDERGEATLNDLIQTDAAINPGNSGGPLLNSYGQVIGINTAIRAEAQNIGFAIQVNKLRDMIPELMDPAQVRKVDLGFKLKEDRTIVPPATVRTSLRLVGGPSANITTINGERPSDLIDAYALLLRVKADSKVTIEFKDPRKDPGKTFTPKQVPLPDAVVQARQRLGIEIEPVTPMLAERMQLRTEEGLLVKEVVRDSAGAKAGLQPGDILVQLGRFQIQGLNDLSSLLPRLPEHGRFRLGVVRGNQIGFTVLQL